MPAFIKTQKDEKIWSRAKSLTHKSYPDLSEDNEDFWKVTNSIYHKIRNNNGVRKSAADIQPAKPNKLRYRVPGDTLPVRRHRDVIQSLQALQDSALSYQKANNGKWSYDPRWGGALHIPSLRYIPKRLPNMCVPTVSAISNFAFGGNPLRNPNTRTPVLTQQLNVATGMGPSGTTHPKLIGPVRDELTKPLPVNTEDFNWYQLSDGAASTLGKVLPASLSVTNWGTSYGNGAGGHMLVTTGNGMAVDGSSRGVRHSDKLYAYGNDAYNAVFGGGGEDELRRGSNRMFFPAHKGMNPRDVAKDLYNYYNLMSIGSGDNPFGLLGRSKYGLLAYGKEADWFANEMMMNNKDKKPGRPWLVPSPR